LAIEEWAIENMNEGDLAHLKESEQRALIEYETQLRQRYNDLIVSIILFGSKARGDAREGSDVDLLVVVNSDDWRLHKELRRLAARVSLRYDLVLSTRIMSQAHFDELRERQTLLFQNIEKDGIKLR